MILRDLCLGGRQGHLPYLRLRLAPGAGGGCANFGAAGGLLGKRDGVDRAVVV